MGKLISQFKEKPKYNYGCNNYIPNYNSINENINTINSLNRGNKNLNNNLGRSPQAAFMGYDGIGEMYGLHKWDGNYK